jgi:hypothetical protein
MEVDPDRSGTTSVDPYRMEVDPDRLDSYSRSLLGIVDVEY